MTRTEKLEQFRSLHERPGLFLFPNPWDAGSAKILTSLGFEALATTSSGFAFSIAGRDNIGELDRDAVLENARLIVEATHLPVAADLIDGFGADPSACAKTIELAVGVGLVGGSIEDATGNQRAPIYPLDQAVERVAASAEVAQRLGFVLTARAEEWLYRESDLDATIERLNAFARAGADVLYAPGLPSLEAIAEVCAKVPKPVNAVMGLRGPTWSVAELNDAGVKRISVGGSLARAAYGALVGAAREMLDEGTFTYASRALPGAEIVRLLA
ncbi:MAG TPA: isocitrate lyase/phosphoenolpyruvate mutase family protein [Thermomicrobiales bacterium]|nr:isocitrate lyase/phosphoenolpyruvate mutase family protein [Thermomicrobiales bacterium]